MMEAKVIKLKKRSPKFVPLLDTKGHAIDHFFVYPKTGVIYYREEFKALKIPPIFKSTRQTTIGRARTEAARLKQRHINQHLGIDDSRAFGVRRTRSFESIAEEILTRVTPQKRPGTQEMHRIYIRALYERFGPVDINAISRTDFSDWIDRQRKTLKRKTFADYAKHMNLVMRYAYNERYATHLVTFKNPDGPKESTGRVYSDAEIKALWASMNDETRDQFVLSYECLMRLREALKLRWDQLDLRSGKCSLKASDVKTGSKTGKGREFILSPRALSRLKARFKARNPRSAYVFPSPVDEKRPMNQNKTAWREAKRKAKIRGRARWHDLRHTALTKALMESRLDPVSVSEYAGVSLRTIQRVYLHSKAEQTKAVAGAVSIP